MLKPCADCPFRADVQFALSFDRARQIAKDVIQGDEAFHCHKTVRHGSSNGEDNLDKAKPCIGAIKRSPRNAVMQKLIFGYAWA